MSISSAGSVSWVGRHLTLVPNTGVALSTLPDAVEPMEPRRLSPGRPGRRRHALLIDGALPGPAERTTVSLAASLRRLGFQASLCPADGCLDQPVDAPLFGTLAQLGVSCLGRPSYRSVEEVLARNGSAFDIVILRGAALAHAYGPLARLHAPAARILFCPGELLHLRLERQAAVQNRPELAGTARLARRQAMLAACAADATLVHSAQEAALLRAALPGHPVHVLPPSPQSCPASGPEAGRARRDGLGLLSDLSDEAALDAARFLVSEVMPLVRARRPGLRLVVPEGAAALLPELAADPLVVRHAGPEPLLARVRLTVAPFRFPAGVRPEVVDSLVAGVPCVVTPPVAEVLATDLPAVAEDAAGLAAAILRLHDRRASPIAAPDDPPAWARLLRQAWSAEAMDAALRPALDGTAIRLRALT